MALRAFRIAKARYPAFDGTGAARVGGRWSSPGRAVVYCAASYAGALLEILVHAQLGRLPGRHHCVVVEIPDGTSVEEVDGANFAGWDAPEPDASRRYGDRWLDEARAAVLIVPSVVARPYERNVLVNPAHPDARRIRVAAPVAVAWDARLFRGAKA